MHGVHYGLLGRNGVGKSTLLRALGHRTIIGFPSNVTTLLVEQELVGDDTTVLQAVLDSDVTTLQRKRYGGSGGGLLLVALVFVLRATRAPCSCSRGLAAAGACPRNTLQTAPLLASVSSLAFLGACQ